MRLFRPKLVFGLMLALALARSLLREEDMNGKTLTKNELANGVLDTGQESGDEKSRAEANGIPWWRRDRWWLAGAAFALGVAYTGLALLLGIEVRFGERDLTLVAGCLVEISFAVFGFLLGLTREARRRERWAASRARARLEELAEAQLALARVEKLAALGQMAGTIAHEVRNPLAILRSMAQNLREELPEQAHHEGEACSEMLEEIDRLAHVTDTLSKFARPLRPERRPVALSALMHRTQVLAERLLPGRVLRLSLVPPPCEARVEADSDLLCQVLLGLLRNAAEASDGQAVVEVGLRWRRRGDWVEVDVRDGGSGVPAELGESIFEPFVTTRGEGSGLGLAVARQILRSHGGEIEVVADAGEGALFRLRLPAAPAQGEAA